MYIYIHNGTDVKGPLKALANKNFEHMGLSIDPREHMEFTYPQLFLSMIEPYTSEDKQIIYMKRLA